GNDAVGAGGDGGAGHDGDGLTGGEGARGLLTGGDLAGQVKIGWSGGDVGGADGVTVHEALVEGRVVTVGGEVFGEVEAVGLGEGDAEETRGDVHRVEDRQCLLDGEEVGYIGF